jgi:hypothetical protein
MKPTRHSRDLFPTRRNPSRKVKTTTLKSVITKGQNSELRDSYCLVTYRVLFGYNAQQYGRANIFFTFRRESTTNKALVLGHAKFGTKTDDNYTYILQQGMEVNNHKHGDDAKRLS